jgi:hypothetical protein
MAAMMTWQDFEFNTVNIATVESRDANDEFDDQDQSAVKDRARKLNDSWLGSNCIEAKTRR